MFKAKYNPTHFVFEIMNLETKKGVQLTLVGPEQAKFLFALVERANKPTSETGSEIKHLKIDSCNVCPFCRPSDNACLRHEPIEARETVYPIPPWCPL